MAVGRGAGAAQRGGETDFDCGRATALGWIGTTGRWIGAIEPDWRGGRGVSGRNFEQFVQLDAAGHDYKPLPDGNYCRYERREFSAAVLSGADAVRTIAH